jgi:PAS domain S-box-containing protein
MKPKKNKYAAEAKFAILLKLIADPWVFSNDQRNIVEASESFEKICGLKREELIGKTLSNCFHLKVTQDLSRKNFS